MHRLNIDFLHKELDTSDSCDDVTWEKYEYVSMMMKEGKRKNKIQLVKNVTKPGHMFQYFKDQLHTLMHINIEQLGKTINSKMVSVCSSS
jgi:hypothetical protein